MIRTRVLGSAVLILGLLFAGLLPPAAATSVAEAAVLDSVIDPQLLQQMNADPLRLRPVIVEMRHAQAPFAARPNEARALEALALLTQFGVPVGALAIIDSAAGLANSVGIRLIALDPRVAYIHADAPVTSLAAAPAYGSTLSPTSVYPRTVGATSAWATGTTGRGVTVAVLDSGIAPHPDFTKPGNRILAAVNFAGPRPVTADPGGHGTHVAGIVAGNGTSSAGEFVGIAPDSGLVDIRVLDANGNGRVSSVVRGIEWAIGHRQQYNIRVLNLSFGTPDHGGYRTDPLAAAVEVAWRRGLVVVAAAGNTGPGGGSVDSPGIDPMVITVGATDDRATASTADDVLATFSAWSAGSGSPARPDLVAPGRRIVSVRVPGSTLDAMLQDHVVVARNGSTYFRLSGTSMSTPIVAGAAALVLQRRPTLTPDQVKGLLVGSTQRFGTSSGASLPHAAAAGSGQLNVAAALAASGQVPPANRNSRPSDGAARALYPVVYGQRLAWKDPLAGGLLWTLLGWLGLPWTASTWDNLMWDNLMWDTSGWNALGWDNLMWDNLMWDNLMWDQASETSWVNVPRD